jgi:Flp pilus assembly pilin Flp
MIEVDYGPAVLAGIIAVVLIAPIVYGLFIDRVKA